MAAALPLMIWFVFDSFARDSHELLCLSLNIFWGGRCGSSLET